MGPVIPHFSANTALEALRALYRASGLTLHLGLAPGWLTWLVGRAGEPSGQPGAEPQHLSLNFPGCLLCFPFQPLRILLTVWPGHLCSLMDILKHFIWHCRYITVRCFQAARSPQKSCSLPAFQLPQCQRHSRAVAFSILDVHGTCVCACVHVCVSLLYC